MSKDAGEPGEGSNERRTHNPETVARRQARAGMPRVRTGPQCVATSTSSGKQCKNAPIKGGTVCRKHGGATKQVKAKARERMMEMVYPALARLEKIIKNPATSDADAIRAMREVFDRAHDAGLSRTAKLEVAVESIWAQLDTVEIARDDGAAPEIDHETRDELGHEIEDWAEERAEPAEPEGEPLDHDGHVVVPGELAEPTGDATSAPPPWERAVVRRGR